MTAIDENALEATVRVVCPEQWHDDPREMKLVRHEVRKTITAYLSALPERELLAEALDAFVHIGEYWNGSRTDGAMSDALDEIVATASAAADKIRAAMGGE
jgi:hypothetical protein